MSVPYGLDGGDVSGLHKAATVEVAIPPLCLPCCGRISSDFFVLDRGPRVYKKSHHHQDDNKRFFWKFFFPEREGDFS